MTGQRTPPPGPFAVTLRSGSSGNCTLISDGVRFVLADCGLSLRALTQSLTPFGLSPDMLSGIFLTHEHSDHTAMLQTACRKLEVPVWGSGGTLNALCGKCIPDGRVIEPDTPVRVGGMFVRRFNTSHDAAESCGYTFAMGGMRVGVCTDLGEMSEGVMDALCGCDYVVLESNHDVEMLNCGPYPLRLRRRILSRFGHLSNEDCAGAVVKLARTGTRRVTLAHLSEENNDPSLALGAAAWALSGHGMELGVHIEIDVAPRRQAGTVFGAVSGMPAAAL